MPGASYRQVYQGGSGEQWLKVKVVGKVVVRGQAAV